jgi:MFS family permease
MVRKLVKQLRRNVRRRAARIAGDKGARPLAVFSAASFLNDLSGDGIKPFWPSFVTQVMGAPPGVLGLLDGLGEAISYGSRMPAGWLSDKIRRRKPMIGLGYLLAGLARLGYALAPVVGWLFPLKAMDRLGKLRDPPRDSFVAEAVPEKQRGHAFGVLNAMDSLGASLGPIAGLVAFALFGYKGLFALAAIPSLMASFLVFRFIKERKPHGIREHYHDHFNAGFWPLTILTGLFALGWLSTSFMVLVATAPGRVPLALAPFLFVLMSLCSTLTSLHVGTWSDRLGRKPVLLGSYAFFTLSMLGFIVFQNSTLQGPSAIAAAFFLFMLYGAHYGAMTAVQPAYVADLVKPHSRAFASGIFQAVFGFAAFGASTLAGLLWQAASPSMAFGTAAGITGAMTLAAAFILKNPGLGASRKTEA